MISCLSHKVCLVWLTQTFEGSEDLLWEERRLSLHDRHSQLEGHWWEVHLEERSFFDQCGEGCGCAGNSALHLGYLGGKVETTVRGGVFLKKHCQCQPWGHTLHVPLCLSLWLGDMAGLYFICTSHVWCDVNNAVSPLRTLQISSETTHFLHCCRTSSSFRTCSYDKISQSAHPLPIPWYTVHSRG